MGDKKAITRVRIERGDTFIELTDPGACQRWDDMAASQAVMAFAHGMQDAPLPWKEGTTDDERTSEFAAGVEAAAKLVEAHCCVSTCCDAQPGASTAEELAHCVRKNVGASTDGARELLEEFVAWLGEDDMRICERAWGENRKMEHDAVSTAINDFIADRARRKTKPPEATP